MGRGSSLFVAVAALVLTAAALEAQDVENLRFDIGSPDLNELWVDPTNGDDSSSGSSRQSALRTFTAAWNKIPQGAALTTGYRINLTAGTYPESSIPNYFESRHGTYAAPIIIYSVDGTGAAQLGGDMNIFDTRYLYLIGINITPDPAGDALHCEQCSYLLLRNVTLNGGSRAAHETLKVNQSQYIFIEDSNIHGADDNAIDFVAVQYGHIVNSLVHNAADWCAYAKGGSAYILVEGNRFYDCGVGGFTAGQGTGFEFMVSPWLHYEAYDMKIVNNVVHDIEGAAFGVNGGYNILVAHNTAYRVGTRSHVLEAVYGLRGCDGNTSACAANVSAGGWGTSTVGTDGEPIPNRNVYFYNNVLLNPSGVRSEWQHFAVHGPRNPSGGTNLPAPVTTDTNLQFKGNMIWNGDGSMPLGIEDDDQGCRPSNATCNATQILAENSINSVEPTLRDPAAEDFRPVDGGTLFGVTTYAIPAFPGGDRQPSPQAPEGTLTNTVARDRSGAARSAGSPPGAYATADAELNEPEGGEGGANAPPTIGSARCAPKKVARRGKVICTAGGVSDDSSVSAVQVSIGEVASKSMRRNGSIYKATVKIPRNAATGRHAATVRATDNSGESTERGAGRIRVTAQ